MVLAIAPLDDITTWLRSAGLEIVLFITGSILLSRAVRWLGARITRRIDDTSGAGGDLVRSESAKHRHALTQVVMWVALVLIWSVAAVLTLQRFGIPVTGLIAPVTVAGVALGFGAQRIVQDLLAGLFIIGERQYGFGDIVRISALGSETGVSGTVEEVTLRITRLRTVNGEVVIVPNGQIAQVTNMSRDWARAVVDVPVPSTADVDVIRKILHEVVSTAAVDEQLGPLLLDPPSVLGVESFELEMLRIRVVARTLPGRQFDVGRELRARIAVAFQDRGITAPPAVDTAEPTGAG